MCCLCHRHPPWRSTTVRCRDRICTSRPQGRSDATGHADQSASSADSPSTATKSLPVRSMSNNLRSRTRLRACGLKSSMSDASISALMLITARSGSSRIHIQGLRRVRDTAWFVEGAVEIDLRPVVMCNFRQSCRNGGTAGARRGTSAQTPSELHRKGCKFPTLGLETTPQRQIAPSPTTGLRCGPTEPISVRSRLVRRLIVKAIGLPRGFVPQFGCGLGDSLRRFGFRYSCGLDSFGARARAACRVVTGVFAEPLCYNIIR